MPTIASTTPIRSPPAVECVALLDMGFEIADVAAGLEVFARPAGKAGLGDRLRSGMPLSRPFARSISSSPSAP